MNLFITQLLVHYFKTWFHQLLHSGVCLYIWWAQLGPSKK